MMTFWPGTRPDTPGDCTDHAAQFVPEDHGLTDHGVPDAPDMVIMKIAPTNAHAAHAQTDETRLRLGDGALLNAGGL